MDAMRYAVYTRFTLTMWDVKEKSRFWSIKETFLFYLNYVGCKDALIAAPYYGYNSFTLTMWDVKEDIFRKSKEYKQVLP